MGTEIQQPDTSDLSTGSKDTFSDGLRRRAWTIGTFVGVIWLVWLADAVAFHGWLIKHGVTPRTLHGLIGIIWAPFLHTSWAHVSGNTMGILLLGGLLILRNEAHFWAVSFLGALAAGLGTWLIGRGNSVHAGASGVVFAYFGYLLFAGIFRRSFGSLLISIAVFLIWGGMLWQILPTQTSVSWEEHVCGLIGGAFAAKLLCTRKADANSTAMANAGQQTDA